MPAVPVSLMEPIWAQFADLLPDHPEVDVTHPLGCHRRRVPDRVVFAHVVDALVHGSGYERIATPGCSDRTIRRRVRDWAEAGLMPRLHAIVLAAYDRMIGLDLGNVAVDGCITKAPGGGEKAGRSPVDRGKQGLKRSTVVDANGIPLGAITAPANDHDSPLLEPTLDTLARIDPLPEPITTHLDRGYDSAVTRSRLDARGVGAEIAEKGKPAPVTAGKRWVVERTNAWINAYKKLVWRTERRARVIDFWIGFAMMIVVVSRLIRQAWTHYRWETRPARRP